MKQLMVHDQKAETVFDLIGSDENAMTYSLGWALAECDGFCESLSVMLGIADGFSDATHIRLQEHVREKGFTDIELHDPGRHHIIIEAKRGFTVPSTNQLEKYADRLSADGDTKANKMLVVLAESDRDDQWQAQHVPTSIKGIAVRAISWKKIQQVARNCMVSATYAEKRWLEKLSQYLGRVTTAQNQNSNMVYVVSLSQKIVFEEQKITYIDVVEKFDKYFHPVGGDKHGWPVEPPNYIAFRYHGILQSIHHVESYIVIENYYPHFPVHQDSPTGEPHYLYELGEAIKPTHRTPTNDPKKHYPPPYRSARKWCFIDLLLTCDSIAEAVGKTKERQNLVYSLDRR